MHNVRATGPAPAVAACAFGLREYRRRRAFAQFVVCACLAAFLVIAACGVDASEPFVASPSEIHAAFSGGQQVDLATSQVSSVVTLRKVVGIPAPAGLVVVKVFRRSEIPPVLRPVFARKGLVGVTINGRYIGILHTPLHEEYKDILAHELVHAYITLASPRPLPFWFQEASAVHFSIDRSRKYYGQPSKTQRWVTEGKIVELTPTYKQKLHSFQFLIRQVGKQEFYRWYKQAVLTGDVDARPLLGLSQEDSGDPSSARRPFPIWLGLVIGAVVVLVVVIGYVASKRGGDYEW